LQKAIDTENYEEAARLRDQLKELEGASSMKEGK
jgi:protein-arginine kinase activator protein McsA